MTYDKILNSELLYVLSKLGHTQTICICDCGLPIPAGKTIIDLSFIPGCIDFLTVYNEIIRNSPFEKLYYAKETATANAPVINVIEKTDIEKESITHEELKKKSLDCYAFVRTGECTPYANVILQAKTIF